MKTAARWALGALAVVALGWGVKAVFLRPDPVPVEVYRVDRGPVEETVSNTRAGTVKVRRRSTISADEAGRILELPHREGETFEESAVLVRVDDRNARAALERARKELTSAEADRRAVGIRCELLAREASRLEALHREGVVSEERADEASTSSRQCRAELQAARERVELARAATAQAEVALERTVTRAPFAGVVNQVFAEVGEFATPGLPVLDVMAEGELYVRAEIDEVDLARVEEGLPVRITLDPYRDRVFSGRVSRVAPFVSEMEEQNRTLEVDVAFEDEADEAGVKPGISADVEIILQTRPGVLRVPRYALLKGDRLAVVEDGRAVGREVEVGLRNWDFAEILSGVQEGEAVVTSLDQEGFELGARVEIEGHGSS